ncbi:MAG: hypothetical protein H0U74_03355 [Bradymonadaceae bacterium]|nr:hypothetical protein [Lujinxingiaceae bacterium]
MVPKALRFWFVFHFVADIVFAAPLLIAPELFLGMFGWPAVDPMTARLVGAALVGIGVESLLGRDAPLESFRTMLRLKILWSGTATLGILVTMLQGGPAMGWLFFAIFASFNGIWTYWFLRLRAISQAAPALTA